jgi:hypothetical protein
MPINIPPQSEIPNGSLCRFDGTEDPLDFSNIFSIHGSRIAELFLVRPRSTPPPKVSGNNVILHWVFYPFFNDTTIFSSPNDIVNYIRNRDFPFYNYFFGIPQDINLPPFGKFVINNIPPLPIKYTPSAGTGNVDSIQFISLENTWNTADNPWEIPGRDPGGIDLPDDGGINIPFSGGINIPNTEADDPDGEIAIPSNFPDINLDIDLRHTSPLFRVPIDMNERINPNPPIIIPNKLIYLTGFQPNGIQEEPHGTLTNEVINIVTGSNSEKLIKTNLFPNGEGGLGKNFYLSFAEAMKYAWAGDVIFVNQALIIHTSAGAKIEVPLIFDLLIYDMIKYLSLKKGVVVILSAGNTARANLDKIATGDFVFASTSEAIIAGQFPIKNGSSGSLVDVYCKTLNGTGLKPIGNNLGESSESSAIVAGMVKNMQSYAKSKGRYLSPLQIKRILKNIPRPLEFNRTILSQDGIGVIIKNKIDLLVP